MATDILRDLIVRLRRTGGGETGGLSDAQLLERYVAHRDEAAFEVLVWRHGGLVLGAARRWLGDRPDADDAFQAAFLTLARKAGSIRRGEALAAWLHQVVCRIALRQRKRLARRRLAEQPLNGFDVGRESTTTDDLGPLLDEEISLLPDRHRRVVILCYLQGCGVAEAGKLLGCPRGTVLSRLAAARARLQRRLLRRGVAPAVLAALTADAAQSSPPASLVAAAVRLGGTTADVPSQVLLMSNGVIRAMYWKHVKVALAVVAIVIAGGVGIGWADKPGKPDPAKPGTEKPAKPADRIAELDGPLPRANPPEDAAIVRDRIRNELQQAEKTLEDLDARFSTLRIDARVKFITLEEKLRELEHRQSWDRAQQQRKLQNLENTRRDRVNQQKAAELAARTLDAELLRAEKIVSTAKDDPERERLLANLKQVVSNRDMQAKQAEEFRQETRILAAEIEKLQTEGASSEKGRTDERVRLRQELATLEERHNIQERALARQRDRAAAECEAITARLRLLPTEPERPESPLRDLQRQVEALQRELGELRREMKRSAKSE